MAGQMSLLPCAAQGEEPHLLLTHQWWKDASGGDPHSPAGAAEREGRAISPSFCVHCAGEGKDEWARQWALWCGVRWRSGVDPGVVCDGAVE